MATPDANKPTAWERLEAGRQAKAAKGGYAGYGSPAFGQQAVDGELVENPQECEIIELIRRHHKSGKSLQRIADWLNHQGYRTKRGSLWQRISVKRVLDRLYGSDVSQTSHPKFTSGRSPRLNSSILRAQLNEAQDPEAQDPEAQD